MKLFTDLLLAHGYVTPQSRDGRETIGLAVEHKPDLILMDIQLPKVSGLEITRQIKSNEVLRDIPVIAVTQFAMRGDKEKIMEGGCDSYIAKPISVPGFLDTVATFIN